MGFFELAIWAGTFIIYVPKICSYFHINIIYFQFVSYIQLQWTKCVYVKGSPLEAGSPKTVILLRNDLEKNEVSKKWSV